MDRDDANDWEDYHFPTSKPERDADRDMEDARDEADAD